MTDDYLSKDREHIAGRQRQRRARMARVDYYPSPDALALIESRRTRYGRTNNNSGILNTIIAEWAALAGLKQSELDKLKSPVMSPELCDQYARVRTGVSSATPEFLLPSRARAGANDFDPRHAKPAHPPAQDTPEFLTASTRANDYGLCHATRAGAQANKSGNLSTGNKARVICSARRRRDGQPCQGLSVPGKQRCKWHGGASTGPRTDEGRVRALANLRQNSIAGTLCSKHDYVTASMFFGNLIPMAEQGTCLKMRIASERVCPIWAIDIVNTHVNNVENDQGGHNEG